MEKTARPKKSSTASRGSETELERASEMGEYRESERSRARTERQRGALRYSRGKQSRVARATYPALHFATAFLSCDVTNRG